MKDFLDFLAYCDDNMELLLERSARAVPGDLPAEDAEKLKQVQKIAASTTLTFLQTYHEWLSQGE